MFIRDTRFVSRSDNSFPCMNCSVIFLCLSTVMSQQHFKTRHNIIFDKSAKFRNFIPKGFHVTPAYDVCTVPKLGLLTSRSEQESIRTIILRHAVHTAFFTNWSLCLSRGFYCKRALNTNPNCLSCSSPE